MILRQVSPAIAAWVLSLGVVLIGARRHEPATPAVPPMDGPALRRLLRYVLVLAAGGYLAMLGIVLVFGVWIVGLGGPVLAGAARGGLVLAAVATPCFLAMSWARARRAR